MAEYKFDMNARVEVWVEAKNEVEARGFAEDQVNKGNVYITSDGLGDMTVTHRYKHNEHCCDDCKGATNDAPKR